MERERAVWLQDRRKYRSQPIPPLTITARDRVFNTTRWLTMERAAIIIIIVNSPDPQAQEKRAIEQEIEGEN